VKKKCLSCGSPFTLSGSGRRQKYCQICAQRGIGAERGLAASKSLKSKAAKSASEFTNPIDLMNGHCRGTVRLRQRILDLELAAPLKGFTVALVLEDEAALIGCGYRVVLCQFRGTRVVLHHAGYTATIKRDVFKELVKLRRKRNRNVIQFPDRRCEPIELELAA